MTKKEIYGIFPKLKTSKHRITSQPDNNYNCVAWVLGITEQYWTPYGAVIPASFPPYFWPKHISQDGSVESLVHLFTERGYEKCDSGNFEVGFEKLAIYQQDGRFTHVAKQLNGGKWSSKLGGLEDIEHEELSALERKGPTIGGNPIFYGCATHFLKRKLRKRST